MNLPMIGYDTLTKACLILGVAAVAFYLLVRFLNTFADMD